MSGETEDVSGLIGLDGGELDSVRQEVARRLGTLPHHVVVLSHDVAANGEFLAELVGA